jgi:hypothetical protein
MTFWLLSGCDQKSGEAICSARDSISFVFLAASKITPDGRCLFTERSVFAFEFFERHSWDISILQDGDTRSIERAVPRRSEPARFVNYLTLAASVLHNKAAWIVPPDSSAVEDGTCSHAPERRFRHEVR